MENKNFGHLIAHIVYIALYGILIISSIALYNSANLKVLLYLGWITLALGFVFILGASQARKKEHIEKDIGKESLVESGMYAFVRHPGFLGHVLVISALTLISQYWISLIIGIILIGLLYLAMIEEEKRNIEKFGSAYRDYIEKVPRINLLIGIIKQTRRKIGKRKYKLDSVMP